MSSESSGDEERLRRLAAGIAHDLNNLLTAIQGRLDLLALELTGDHPLREDLDEIQEDARTAARVVARLVELTGQAPTRPRATEITELLNGVEEEVFDRRRGEVRVLTVLEAGAGPVRVDPGQIRRVIKALVDNALEAIPGKGVLLIRSYRMEVGGSENEPLSHLEPGVYVCLEVGDTGTGMDAVTLSRVFDPYFSTKASGAGRGLQLAAARQIVRQNGGAIHFESETGRGTTAYLVLPVHSSRETSNA